MGFTSLSDTPVNPWPSVQVHDRLLGPTSCSLGIRPGLPWIKRLYNGAQFSLAGYFARTVHQALDAAKAMTLVIPCTIATVIFITVNTILVAVMVRLAAGPRSTAWSYERYMPFILIYLGGNVLGLAMVLLWPYIGPYSAILLIAPYVVRHVARHLRRDRGIGVHRRVKALPWRKGDSSPAFAIRIRY